MKKLPIGISNFEEIRQKDYLFIDKSLFIADVLDGAKVQLITRPRRFGKTLNLSMLHWFLKSQPDQRRQLFDGLEIATNPAMNHPTMPVIYFTLKDLKCNSLEQLVQEFGAFMSTLYGQFLHLRLALPSWEQDLFDQILHQKAGTSVLTNATSKLMRWIFEHHQSQTMVLIDEYDTPLHEAWRSGFFDEAVNFMRSFLGRTLKDNDHLDKGVLTGILRVSKESIFSDLNNLKTYTVLDKKFSSRFGFTEQEMAQLVGQVDAASHLADLQHWYNGYQFAGQVIYNPWSVLNFLEDREEPKAYWVNTSGNQLVHELLAKADPAVHQQLIHLLDGQAVTAPISSDLTFKHLRDQSAALWTLLVFSGYLTPVEKVAGPGRPQYRLQIPNQEVRSMFYDTFLQWFDSHYGLLHLNDLHHGLITGNAEVVQAQLVQLVGSILSYYDTAAPQPERVYHLFVLGMLVSLKPRFEIRSNRESGLGRYDIMMRPTRPDDPGIILEFKTFKGDDPEAALEAAVTQMRERDYAAELREAGVLSIHQFAVACNGKQVHVISG